jgi:regulator of cell morphogenesis and NO signaling
LGEIELSVDRIAEVYGQKHPLLVLLRTFFQRYKAQLAEHIEDEEKVLFPHAQKIYKAKLAGEYTEDTFDYDQFLHSHGEDELDTPLREIQQLVERQHPEVKTLFPYNVLNWQLNALQQDLWIHERIEEDVLIGILNAKAEGEF